MDDPHRHTWPGGRCPDGRDVPQPAAFVPPPRRVHRTVLVVAAVVLALMVAGIAGWRP